MNMDRNKALKKRRYNRLTWIISIFSVIIILAINYMPRHTAGTNFGEGLTFLPLLNAILNAFTIIFLVLALVMIKRKNIKAHRRFIYAAFAMTIVFLISYLTYHTLAGSTTYFGEGAMRTIYYFLLITHVLFAIILRSEERRVGKECRSRLWRASYKNKY